MTSATFKKIKKKKNSNFPSVYFICVNTNEAKSIFSSQIDDFASSTRYNSFANWFTETLSSLKQVEKYALLKDQELSSGLVRPFMYIATYWTSLFRPHFLSPILTRYRHVSHTA